MIASTFLNIKRIKRTINQCQSPEDLKEIIRAAQERMAELRKQEIERTQKIVWDALSKAKEGHVAVVFNGTEITMEVSENGARLTRLKRCTFLPGMVLHVHALQPRAKRLWLRNSAGDKIYRMEARELGTLDIRVFPDELTAHVAIATRRTEAEK